MTAMDIVPANPAMTQDRATWFLAWAGLCLGYVLVFSLTGSSAVRALGVALVNVLPAMALGWLARRWILARVAGLSGPSRLAAHLVTGAAFVAAWYAALIPGLGLAGWFETGVFAPRPLTGPALPWQLFQGAMIYAVIAASTRPASDQDGGVHAETAATRYLMRRGDEIRPVAVSEIVCIRGADDYSEVETATGLHLARMTLRAFEAELSRDRFLRVHRSCIVNFDRLERAEPAGGGRLLLYMDNGAVVTSSRAGAQLLRDRLI